MGAAEIVDGWRRTVSRHSSQARRATKMFTTRSLNETQRPRQPTPETPQSNRRTTAEAGARRAWRSMVAKTCGADG